MKTEVYTVLTLTYEETVALCKLLNEPVAQKLVNEHKLSFAEQSATENILTELSEKIKY